jgi:hypothetical protein
MEQSLDADLPSSLTKCVHHQLLTVHYGKVTNCENILGTLLQLAQ